MRCAQTLREKPVISPFLFVAMKLDLGIMIIQRYRERSLPIHTFHSGVKLVSTGVLKREKRAAVCSVCVKKGTLNTNAKNNNRSFALAA